MYPVDPTSKPTSWKKGPSPTCSSKSADVFPGIAAARCATDDATMPAAASRASASTTAPATGSPAASAMNTLDAPTASTIQSMIFSQRTTGSITSDRSGSRGGRRAVSTALDASSVGGGPAAAGASSGAASTGGLPSGGSAPGPKAPRSSAGSDPGSRGGSPVGGPEAVGPNETSG